MKLSLKKAIISAVVVLAGVNFFMPVASVFAAPASNSTTIQETETARCDAGALTWIVCPVITLSQEFVEKMEEWIVNRLDMGPLQTTGRYENLHNAWAAFRDLANFFFVGVFFVIIFAQALSIKMDSYSLKMLLPRLIVAAIAIQFSFFIMQIGVDISNIVGAGIAGIFQPLVPAGAQTADAGTVAASFGALTLVGGAGVLAASAFITGLAVPTLLLLLAGAIALLGVIITVWLRVLVLQFLVILAPLAIVAWVLPNTEKWFVAWRINVVKLLLMYPIIVFMISAGALATHLTNLTAETSEFAKVLAACIPIIIFFMIPAAIKASGSLMALTAAFVMGHTNSYTRAVRNSTLMKDGKQNFKDRAALAIADNDKNLDRFNTPAKKSAAMLRRGAGRVGSGNALAIGAVGRRNIAKSTEHARHVFDADEQTRFRENAFENPSLMKIAQIGMDHNHKDYGKTREIEDRYGKKHKIKYNHHTAEAAIGQLVAQSGFVELSELIDGKKVDTPLGENTGREGGLFDHDIQMWRDKETQATMNRAFGPNAGNVLKKITHAVHLQADRAYGAIGASDFAQLGAGSGIVAAREGREWGATNMLNAMLNVSNSTSLSSSIQNDVAASMKRELLAAAREGKFNDIVITTKDEPGGMNATQWLNKYVSDSGHVTYLSTAIGRSGIDEAIRAEKEEIDRKVAELDARREQFRKDGPRLH